MSKVKVKVYTDKFDVELPCVMMYGSLEVNITGYDTDESLFVSDTGDKFYLDELELIPEKKMIPWTIEDFKEFLFDGGIVKDADKELYHCVTGVNLESDKIKIGNEWARIYRILDECRKKDGSKFEKESK